MVDANLDTTNVLLGIMAAVSVLEGLILIGLGVMAYKVYSQTVRMVREVEERHIAPLAARANTMMTTIDGVLADVRGITARVGAQTERVDSAISSTIDRVEETAGRVRSSVASRVSRIVGLMQGLRAAASTMFNGHTRNAA